MDLSAFLTEALMGYFVIFARLGSALMFMPGFGEASVPVRHRLFFGLILSAALYPATGLGPVAEDRPAALLVIFGIGRPLLKRRAAAQEAAAAERAEQKQVIGQAISTELTKQAVANPAAPTAPVTLDMISSTYDYAQRADLIRNFVKQDPDRAALVVRDLLKDAKKEKENA